MGGGRDRGDRCGPAGSVRVQRGEEGEQVGAGGVQQAGQVERGGGAQQVGTGR